MSSSAKPLKFSTPGKSSNNENDIDKTPGPSNKLGRKASLKGNNTPDISSPHELTAFVETLLEQLDKKFDDMSSQILDRMTQMSTRVDNLEASIQDIINGDVTGSVPQSPAALPGIASVRRSDSGPA